MAQVLSEKTRQVLINDAGADTRAGFERRYGHHKTPRTWRVYQLLMETKDKQKCLVM
jgi:hypothetical protein